MREGSPVLPVRVLARAELRGWGPVRAVRIGRRGGIKRREALAVIAHMVVAKSLTSLSVRLFY